MKVSASPCLIVHPTDTIRCTIEAMQKSGSSYVLVCNDLGEVVGIFTDKDIMSRFFEFQNDNLLRPITAFMTSPVLMLPLSKMDEAPKLMRERNIRHVPIFQTEEGRHHVLGIVTLKRLVVENLLGGDLQKKTRDPNQTPRAIGILAADMRMESLLRSVFPEPEAHINRLSYLQLEKHSELDEALSPFDVLVFDLDDVPERSWRKILSSINTFEEPLPVLLCLTPTLHSREILQTIQKLTGAPWIQVFQKPVDLVALRIAVATATSEQ